MNRSSFRAAFLAFVFLSSFVFSVSSYAATPVDLDSLAEKLAPEIDKAGGDAWFDQMIQKHGHVIRYKLLFSVR